MLPSVITLVCCIWLMALPDVLGHGRLVEPPSRSSMWRFDFDTPRNYNDNQLYCGGFQVQWGENGGKCGVCGDPWNGTRENEAGGKYANGIIVRKYKKGETITTNVDLTANHKGYFQFRLCPHNDPQTPVKQECLDRYLLRHPDGSDRFNITTARQGIYNMTVKLPDHVTCSQCVLQWKYTTGNSWGCDGSGCCVGCGPQEEFYGCADVSISADDEDQTTSKPSTSKTSPSQETTKPAVVQTTSESRNITKTSTDTTTSSTTATTVTSSPTSATTSEATTSVTDSTTDNSDETSDDCKAVGVWEGNPRITVWCIGNCERGYCPDDYCSEACRQMKRTEQ